MTLFFDIETVGRTIDADFLASLRKRDEDADDKLGLSPFTGEAVVIAVWDDMTNAGACLVASAVSLGDVALPDGFTLRTYLDERGMLEAFWAGVKKQRRVATFNGNGFDVPFLVGRSLALGVEIDRRFIDAKPWEDFHVDLMARLMPGRGMRASFDVVCRGLGVPSPKSEMDGSEVHAAWRSGRGGEVAAYCCRDVEAGARVLAKWDRFALGRRDPTVSMSFGEAA